MIDPSSHACVHDELIFTALLQPAKSTKKFNLKVSGYTVNPNRAN